MTSYNNAIGLVSPGIFNTLILVVVLGTVLLSPTVINEVMAIDMSDAPMTKDSITAGSDGTDDEDQGDNDQEDAPVTQGTITAGGESRADNDEDNSGQNNNGKDDDEPTTEIKDVPNCPAGQENGLFTTCMPIHSCDSQPPLGVISPNTNNCVNAPLVDHPSRVTSITIS